MSELASRGADVDAAVGRQVGPDLCKAWVAELLKRRPEMKGQLQRFISREQGPGGVPVRKRWDMKYSRVGVSWDGAGNLMPDNPTALFSQQIGQVDPVLGKLSEVDTNVIKGGSQTSNELFKGFAIGFKVELIDLGSATVPAITQAEVADLFRMVLENTSANLTAGTQNNQRLPPLVNMPGIGVGFQNASTVSVATATQGKQSLLTVNPAIYLPAGASYSVELKMKRQLSGGTALIPSAAVYADFKLAISCVMYGVSYTGIPG